MNRFRRVKQANATLKEGDAAGPTSVQTVLSDGVDCRRLSYLAIPRRQSRGKGRLLRMLKEGKEIDPAQSAAQ